MKVYFAGYAPAAEALDDAGVMYALDSFYVLRKSNNEKAIEHVGRMNAKQGAIIDSGLFTLMFGAEAGGELTEEFFEKWQHDYIAFIKGTGFEGIVVECDVQKKISTEYAWELRKRFKKDLPDNEQINVYHLEDGNPDKLIQWSDYIAVSIPELRLNVGRKERYRITSYISRKALAAGKKVHLLGCTEVDMMRRFRYCTSCDSTSWKNGEMYDRFSSGMGKVSMGAMRSKANARGYALPSTQSTYYQGVFKLEQYKRLCGDQS